MNIFAKDWNLIADTDTRTWREKRDDEIKANGIDALSLQEIEEWLNENGTGHPLTQAYALQERILKNAADTRTTDEKYADAPASIWN